MSAETSPTPLDTPLGGGRTLIEASAGSGKTRAITTLVARLIVEADLRIEDIQVVTFTNAATADLRKKIRETLKTIQDVERSSPSEGQNQPKQPQSDKFDQARELLGKWKSADQPDHAQIRERINGALLEIDRANICTIHSFCQKSLTEFAFETGFPFGFELSGEGTGIVEGVVGDIWQRRFKDCSAALASLVLASGGDSPAQRRNSFLPEALAQWFGGIRSRQFHQVKGAPESRIEPGERERALISVLAQVRDCWGKKGGKFCHILREDSALNRTKYNKSTARKKLAEIQLILFSHELPRDLERLEALAEWFGANRLLNGGCKRGHPPPQSPLFEAFDSLSAACSELSQAYRGWLAQVRRELIDTAGADIRQVVRDERTLAYDDLLIELRDALASGPLGERLAETLRRRFPVALIDEFQDTDPTQEQIFARIYGNAASSDDSGQAGASERPTESGNSKASESGQPNCALYLVGDPKQSIYEFRGADIFAYLKAQKTSTTGLLLAHNWRSTPELVGAVNAVFNAPLAFTIPEIRFHGAIPGREDPPRLMIEGKAEPALSFWLSEEKQSNDKINEVVAGKTADDIVHLLNLAQEGKAKIGEKTLKASDIAVLVAQRVQGRAVANALRERGGKSVEIDRSSIFATREAEQLRRLLLALAQPQRQDYQRAALTGDLFGLDSGQLLDLNEDDDYWNEWSGRFGEWRKIWLSLGVGAMLRRIIDASHGAGNLLRQADGPRQLANWHHLTELLQETETQNRFSPAGVLAWLGRRMVEQDGARDEQREEYLLRLDSDEDLVKIMTIHASKGLEFPVVYVPFAWYTKSKNDKPDQPIIHHVRESGEFPAILDLAPDQDSREKRRLEEFGESVRHLYVALTRAEKRCVVAWTRAKKIEGKELPPLAWLLHRNPQADAELIEAAAGGQSDSSPESTPEGSAAVPESVAAAIRQTESEFANKSWAELRADIEALANKSPQAIEVQNIARNSKFTDAVAAKSPAAELQCRKFQRPIHRLRQMTSFTALTANQAAAAGPPAAAETAARDYDESTGSVAVETEERGRGESEEPLNAFTFPRGIKVGTCLHGIFETLMAEPGRDAGKVCAEQMERAGIDAKWRDTARDMVQKTRATELREPGQTSFRLDEIEKHLIELEFHFPVNGLRLPALAEILQNHGYAGLIGGEAGNASTEPIDGFMRGFIDLTVQWEGRWYILDYKSNWLGHQAKDYATEKLEAEMRAHRYPLQCLIYLLALHRYLGSRLPGYDYERHVGGAFYLFLRGMDPAAGMSRGVWFQRPSRQCIEALDRFMGGAAP